MNEIDTASTQTLIPVAYARPGSKKGKLWQRIHGRLSVPLESAQPIEAGSPLGRRMFLFVNIWRCGNRGHFSNGTVNNAKGGRTS